MKEFRSKLEELMPAEELRFAATPGFGAFKPYLDHAKAHPAKMNTWLLEWLIKAFTKPGDTVLDPMAGSGSTGVVAAVNGRNAVQVELERKFYDWMEKARETVESDSAIQQKGWIKNVLGDARCLSQLLQDADACITSPPYSESMTKRRKGYTIIPQLAGTRHMGEYTKDENLANLPHGNVDLIVTSPPYERQLHDSREKRAAGAWNGSECDVKKNLPMGYSENPNNIGNLPLGKVDTIVTSPPYSDSAIQDYGESNKALLAFEAKVRRAFRTKGYFQYKGKKYTEQEWRKINKGELKPRGVPELWAEIIKQKRQNRYNDQNPCNIANFLHGSIDAVLTSPHGEISTVITSPPYEASVSDDKESPLVGGNESKYGRWRKGTARKHSYTQHGEPCKVDSIITSPPYEGSLEGTSRHTRGGIASRDPALAQTGSYATVMSFGVPIGYSANSENIGNLKNETYLEAMQKVYAEMFRVLAPGGLAIIVVKAFIRNKQPVDLPLHTWLLMEKAGFRLVKLYKFKLPQQSFWRILQYIKHPEAPVLAHEHVLICQKHGGNQKVEPQIDPHDFFFDVVCEENTRRLQRSAL